MKDPRKTLSAGNVKRVKFADPTIDALAEGTLSLFAFMSEEQAREVARYAIGVASGAPSRPRPKKEPRPAYEQMTLF